MKKTAYRAAVGFARGPLLAAYMLGEQAVRLGIPLGDRVFSGLFSVGARFKKDWTSADWL